MKKWMFLCIFLGSTILTFAQNSKEKQFDGRLKGMTYRVENFKKMDTFRSCANILSFIDNAKSAADLFPNDAKKMEQLRKVVASLKKADANLYCEKDGDGAGQWTTKCTCDEAKATYEQLFSDRGWSYN